MKQHAPSPILLCNLPLLAQLHLHGPILRIQNRPAGHIGFLGHGSLVEFRNIRIKVLPASN